MSGELSALAELAALRAELDERELTLIDRARQRGSTWAQIAGALGLASRQAAEQRRHRLDAAARARRLDADRRYAPPLARLRLAVTELHRWIVDDRRWESRFPRAALVRGTLAAALDAPAGALHALAAHAAADLAELDPTRLPPAVRAAVPALHRALSTAR
ncbi:hypothetical protein [Micromonospora auratinigra]|uniref:Uncharacterized protein n=1 Tax=Micromonospora auratinigra TaxID=261654 RepID=A0A1A8Z8T7_9ACTN|nr:hypothetical protein [Micromonospora auratinigra]SBT40371.1 hypothetical protein GA0070611_1237 [Micromonospora auratinigra]